MSNLMLTFLKCIKNIHFLFLFLEECIKIKVIVQKTGGGTIDFWMKYGDKES